MQKKIYIISLSPTLDYILKFDHLQKGETNRPKSTQIYSAGKGIHVSMILNNLNIENESLIFSNGDFEKFFYKGLDLFGVKYKKFKALNDIRINLKLIDQDETECSVTTSDIELTEINKMKKYLKQNVKPGDYVIATGSIPKNVNSKIYGEIVHLVNSLNANCIVDTFGEPLNYAIKNKPFLVKPNLKELSLTTGIVCKTLDDIIKAAKKLLENGTQNILVSMGSEGAIFVNKQQIIKCGIGNWNKKLVNAAGAGDSMVGGFLSEFMKTNDYQKSLKMAVICGSATAYSDQIASIDLIQELTKSIDDLKIESIT